MFDFYAPDADFTAIFALFRAASIEVNQDTRYTLQQLAREDAEKLVIAADQYEQQAKDYALLMNSPGQVVAGSVLIAGIASSISLASSLAKKGHFTNSSLQAPSAVLTQDTGASDMDGVTSDAHLTVEGTKGSYLSYVVDGGPASADYNVADLSQGAHTLVVTQTEAGKTSPATTVRFILDTTPPPALIVTLAHDTGNGLGITSTDRITSDASLAFSNQEPDSLLQYPLDGIAYTPTVISAHEGANDYFVRQVDLAGNVGDGSRITFVLDQTAPAALGVALRSDTGASHTDKVTSDATFVFQGQENGSLVEYSLDGKSWSSSPVTKEGLNDIFVHQVDVAGNAGVSSEFKFTLDTTAPKPMLTNVTDKGLIGTSEANSTVSIFDNGKLLGTVKAGADGSWSFATNAPGNTIHSYTETATDLAGNTGSSTGIGLYLPAANRALVGGSGDDVLIGRPKDTLTGGDGHDTFVFNIGFGKQTVTDFHVGADVLAFDHTLFVSTSDVLSPLHATQDGLNTSIKDVSGDVLTLLDVNLSDLKAANQGLVDWVHFV